MIWCWRGWLVPSPSGQPDRRARRQGLRRLWRCLVAVLVGAVSLRRGLCKPWVGGGWSCGTLVFGAVFEGDGIEWFLVAQDAVDGLENFAGDVAEGDFARLFHDFSVLVVAVFE